MLLHWADPLVSIISHYLQKDSEEQIIPTLAHENRSTGRNDAHNASQLRGDGRRRSS